MKGRRKINLIYLSLKLSASDYQKLVESMVQAYPQKIDLQMIVTFGLEEYLDVIVGGETVEKIIFNLILWAKARGKFIDLLNAVSQHRPDNFE